MNIVLKVLHLTNAQSYRSCFWTYLKVPAFDLLLVTDKEKQQTDGIQQISENVHMLINSFPNHKILDGSKFKSLADNKINVNNKLKYGLGRVENIVEKGNYQHCHLFPQSFQKISFSVTCNFSFFHNVLNSIRYL